MITESGICTSQHYNNSNLFTHHKKCHITERWYLGSKTGVLKLIEEILKKEVGKFTTFCDIFSGSGVVGHHFNNPDISVISNDILLSNYLPLTTWLSPDEINEAKLFNLIKHLNSINSDNENYVSLNFGSKYWSHENARKIGAIREEIENLQVTFREKAILITSLLYAMDKVANTVGHYDTYLKKIKQSAMKPLHLALPCLPDYINKGNRIFNEDANKLIRKIECDVLYLDPPYNSRQYCDAYHLPENITRWKKPELHGTALKYREGRELLKSSYNKKNAPEAFLDLIQNAKCRFILLSYNNMKDKGDPRSNAKISDDLIMNTLRTRGIVKVFHQQHKAFSAGKSSIKNNCERVFFCKVK